MGEGACLIFAWGPPWNWRPSVERSRFGNGVSLTWLWWGIYYHPRGVGELLYRSAKHRMENPDG